MMREEDVAHAFLAPAMIQMMLLQPDANDAAYPQLKSIAYGASPIAEDVLRRARATFGRSEEHTSELQSLMRISYAVFCLKKKNNQYNAALTLHSHMWSLRISANYSLISP